MKRPHLRSCLPRPHWISGRFRLITSQNVPNLPARMMKPTSHLANTHSILMSTPTPSVILHREHPSLPNHSWRKSHEVSRDLYGGYILHADHSPDMGPFCTPISMADRGAIEQNFRDVKEVEEAGQQQLATCFSTRRHGMYVCGCIQLVELWPWRHSGGRMKQRNNFGTSSSNP